MRSSKRIFSMAGVLILLGMVTLSGCATKKYVQAEVATASGKLDTRVNETNTKVTEAGERIDAVDRRATTGIQAADQKATQAGQAASAADQKAVNAQRTADTATQAAQQVNTRVTTVESRFNTIDTYTVSGPPQSVTFRSGSATLSDDAKRTLDAVASQVANRNSGFIIEVQGFTDALGSENSNIGLSERRAQSVKRYLVSKNIPLMRIAIVGLGEDSPVADNKTRAGREQNRRVEIKVLQSAQGRTGSN